MATGKETGTRFSASLVIGLLLVPLSAVAAVVLMDPEPVAPASAAQPSTTTITSAAGLPTEQRIVVEPVTSSEEDLAAACGSDGHLLVELEAEETISEIQQAALDALRQLCEEVGMPLPDPPAPPPIVKTVVEQSSSSDDGGDSDRHHEDDDDDEYEDEEDDDEEDEEDEDEEDEEDEDEEDEEDEEDDD